MIDRKKILKHRTIPNFTSVIFAESTDEHQLNFSFSEENTGAFHGSLATSPKRPFASNFEGITPCFSTYSVFEHECNKKIREMTIQGLENTVGEEDHAKRVKVKECANTEKIKSISPSSDMDISMNSYSKGKETDCLFKTCQTQNFICGCKII
jgi:hypothetical protein